MKLFAKECFKCGETKWLDDFYRHPRMADGHLGKCKQCTRRDVHQNYRSNIEHYRVYERERFQRPERKAAVVEYARRSRRRDPRKDKARKALNNAIRSGRVERQPCEVCGKPDAEAHHEDYSRPFDVRWLCFKHHREAHGQIVAN